MPTNPAFSVATLRAFEVCDLAERLSDLAAALGREPAEDEAIPLSVWWELPSTSIQDRVWALRYLDLGAIPAIREFTRRCMERAATYAKEHASTHPAAAYHAASASKAHAAAERAWTVVNVAIHAADCAACAVCAASLYDDVRQANERDAQRDDLELLFLGAPLRPGLLCPYDTLPGPVPEGAPIWHARFGRGVLSTYDGSDYAYATFLRVDGLGRTRHFGERVEVQALRLDLSTPPTNAQGWPRRIDGFDVLVAALARAMGMDPREVIFKWDGNFWVLRGPSRVLYFTDREVPSWAHGTTYSVPALATVDPANPTAARRALVVVALSKPWEAA